MAVLVLNFFLKIFNFGKFFFFKKNNPIFENKTVFFFKKNNFIFFLDKKKIKLFFYLKNFFHLKRLNFFFFFRKSFFFSKTKLSRIRQICKNIVIFTLALNVFFILKTVEVYFSFHFNNFNVINFGIFFFCFFLHLKNFM